MSVVLLAEIAYLVFGYSEASAFGRIAVVAVSLLAPLIQRGVRVENIETAEEERRAEFVNNVK